MTKAVTILSGGMDSTTLAYRLAEEYDSVDLVSFDYGQRHKVELAFARITAHKLSARHDAIDLSAIQPLIADNSLTDPNQPVPDGHYAQENMKQTVVPNRNAIMLSIAYGIAAARQADVLAFGAHGGDHFIYPDCRPLFANLLGEAFEAGSAGFATTRLIAPFINIDKTEIARIGDRLGVPWADTWSCYKGGAIHCGTCGTCVERIGAFAEAGVADPTEYLDRERGLAILAAGPGGQVA